MKQRDVKTVTKTVKEGDRIIITTTKTTNLSKSAAEDETFAMESHLRRAKDQVFKLKKDLEQKNEAIKKLEVSVEDINKFKKISEALGLDAQISSNKTQLDSYALEIDRLTKTTDELRELLR